MNKYKELLNIFVKAKSEFEKYESNCIEVDLSLMRCELPIRDVTLLHVLVSRYTPDLILSQMMSHGGVDCMKIVAPRNEVLEGLELLLLHYEDSNNEYMAKVISELHKAVSNTDKTRFSLSKMLKQLDL